MRESYYFPGFGISASVGTYNLKVDSVRVGLFLSYSLTNSNIYQSNYSPGGGTSYDFFLKEHTISLELLPITLLRQKNLNLSFGLWTSYVLTYDVTGEFNSWSVSTSGKKSKIEKKSGQLVNFGIGPSFELIYKIKITDKLQIAPQLHLYYNLNNEFNKIGYSGTKSFLFNYSLAFIYRRN